MGISIDANLAYGFGFAAESEEYEQLVETLTKLLGDTASEDARDALEAGYAEDGVDELLEQREFDLIRWELVGSSDDYYGTPGIFIAAKSRTMSVVCGGLLKVASLMQSGLEDELAEYAQLVECAKLLGVDPDSIGWYLFSDVG